MQHKRISTLCLVAALFAVHATSQAADDSNNAPFAATPTASADKSNSLIVAYSVWNCTAQSNYGTGFGISPIQNNAVNIAMHECRMRTPPHNMCFIVDCHIE